MNVKQAALPIALPADLPAVMSTACPEGQVAESILPRRPEQSYDEYFEQCVRITRAVAQRRWQAGERTSPIRLFARPLGRFLRLYVLDGGLARGIAGWQDAVLQAFFGEFIVEARLWAHEHVTLPPEPCPPGAVESPRNSAS